MRSATISWDEEAFTLVELIMVIVVIAISAVVVVPLVVGTSDLQVISAARIVASDLQYAQNMAIAKREPVTVTFTPGTESVALSNARGALIHPITKDTYTTDFRVRNGFGKVDIVSADFSGSTSVTFDEMGSPDNAGTVTLQAGSHVYTVDVAAATGKVTASSAGP